MRRILAALAIAVGLLALVELGLRLAPGPDVYRADPVLGWRLRPGMRERKNGLTYPITSNSEGLRNPQVARRKDRFRILCLGDSVTFGLGVDDHEAWPRRLEEALRGRGCDVEVINAGMTAYHSQQACILFTELQPLYQPDLVVVTLLNNEAKALPFLDWERHARRSTLRELMYRSELCQRLLRAKWRLERMDQQSEPSRAGLAYRPIETWEAFGENLSVLADRARAAGAGVMFVEEALEEPGSGQEPRIRPSISPEQRLWFTGALRDVALEKGVPLVVVSEEEGYDPSTFFTEMDFIHPGVQGCRFMGERVGERLVEEGLVPCR